MLHAQMFARPGFCACLTQAVAVHAALLHTKPRVGENSVFHFLAFVCRASAGEGRQEARQGCR